MPLFLCHLRVLTSASVCALLHLYCEMSRSAWARARALASNKSCRWFSLVCNTNINCYYSSAGRYFNCELEIRYFDENWYIIMYACTCFMQFLNMRTTYCRSNAPANVKFQVVLCGLWLGILLGRCFEVHWEGAWMCWDYDRQYFLCWKCGEGVFRLTGI